MKRTNEFISEHVVYFPKATCILHAKTTTGCEFYVPVNVSDEQEQSKKHELQSCVDLDESDMIPDQPPPSPSVA